MSPFRRVRREPASRRYPWWISAVLALLALLFTGLTVSALFAAPEAGQLDRPLRSGLRANYAADPRGQPLAALDLALVDEVARDLQPTARPSETAPTPVPVNEQLRTPVPTVTPLPALHAQPSATAFAVAATAVPSATLAAVEPTRTNTPEAAATLAPTATRLLPTRTPPPTPTRRPTNPPDTATPRPTLPPRDTDTPQPTWPPHDTDTPQPPPATDTPAPPPATDTPAPPPATNTPHPYQPPPPTNTPGSGYP
jgi:hypothetical protein